MALWGSKIGSALKGLQHPDPVTPQVEVTPSVKASPESGERWIGFVDYISSGRISGWAVDRLNPDMSLAVEAVSSEGKRIVTIANVFREDVLDAGYGSTGKLGFDLDIGRLRLTSGTIVVKLVESGVLISKEPIELDPQLALINGDLPEKYASLLQSLAGQAYQVHAMYKELGSVF